MPGRRSHCSANRYNGSACAARMSLLQPLNLRLTSQQLTWLDSWRGQTLSRSAAIRLLLDQAIQLHPGTPIRPTDRR